MIPTAAVAMRPTGSAQDADAGEYLLFSAARERICSALRSGRAWGSYLAVIGVLRRLQFFLLQKVRHVKHSN
jgi:hypothetical protein